MVQVTFMGTGAAFSTRRRTNVALLVRDDSTEVLVECGPNVLHQLDHAGSAAGRINCLFISHRHGDHILGLPLFLLSRSPREGAAGPFMVLGSEDVIQAGQELTRIVFPELVQRLLNLSWVTMPDDRVGKAELSDAIALSTLPTPHSPEISSLALRLDFGSLGCSLVYTGDTTYSEELAGFAAGCDLLIHEANFSRLLHPEVEAGDYGHSTAFQAGSTANQAGCRILALVHLNPEYVGREGEVRADAAAAFGGEIIIPEDGTTLFL
jgi:ribonuclease Z